LLGLEVGAGAAFTPLELPQTQQAQRTAPGAQTQWNGAMYQPSARRLPDQTPPPDLRGNPSFFEPTDLSPAENTLGQQMPAATSNAATYGGAESAYALGPSDPRESQGLVPAADWYDPQAAHQLQSFEDTRRVADQQLQQAMQNAWGPNPAASIPSPSMGAPYERPAPPASQMESWERNIRPVPYAQGQPPASRLGGAMPQISPSQSPPGARAPAPLRETQQPQYRPGAIVPESYSRRLQPPQ
jgi:hypothetical protein